MALITAKRKGGQYGLLITDATNNSMKTDIPQANGGDGDGMRPMQTLLAALAACSTVDIVSILNKQKQTLDSLDIEIDGQREKGKEPALWESISIHFILTGNIEPAKAYRAAELSIDKYCSVAETLRRAGAAITWTITVNNEAVTL